jgi:hypothetical protein
VWAWLVWADQVRHGGQRLRTALGVQQEGTSGWRWSPNFTLRGAQTPPPGLPGVPWHSFSTQASHFQPLQNPNSAPTCPQPPPHHLASDEGGTFLHHPLTLLPYAQIPGYLRSHLSPPNPRPQPFTPTPTLPDPLHQAQPPGPANSSPPCNPNDRSHPAAASRGLGASRPGWEPSPRAVLTEGGGLGAGDPRGGTRATST